MFAVDLVFAIIFLGLDEALFSLPLVESKIEREKIVNEVSLFNYKLTLWMLIYVWFNSRQQEKRQSFIFGNVEVAHFMKYM